MYPNIFDQSHLAHICQKYQVYFLGVFGSYSRGDQKPESDMDLLVKFSPDEKGGLFALSRMRDDLEHLSNKKIDLLTEGFLSKYFRDEVLAETKPLYVKTQ